MPQLDPSVGGRELPTNLGLRSIALGLPGSDFAGTSGTVTFLSGETTKQIQIGGPIPVPAAPHIPLIDDTVGNIICLHQD